MSAAACFSWAERLVWSGFADLAAGPALDAPACKRHTADWYAVVAALHHFKKHAGRQPLCISMHPQLSIALKAWAEDHPQLLAKVGFEPNTTLKLGWLVVAGGGSSVLYDIADCGDKPRLLA